MTKDSLAWLAIRIFGLFLLWRTAYGAFSVFGHAAGLNKLYEIANSQFSAAYEAEQQLVSAWVELIGTSVWTVLIGIGAIYFLLKGKKVHTLLMREESAGNSD